MKIVHNPSPEKIEQVKKIVPKFGQLCTYYVRPILFGELPLKTLDPILKGATVTFINTGEKAFGITNFHVYKKYLELKNANTLFKCQINTLTIDLESRIIDFNADSSVDIITFDMTNDEFKKINVIPLFHKSWPVKYKEDETEPVFILGFPLHLRKIENLQHIIASFGTFMVTIASITDKRLNMVFDRDNWITCFDDKPVDISNIRGFSGSGVFRMNNIVPELLGIVSDHAEGFDILFCTRSDLISKDGQIQKMF